MTPYFRKVALIAASLGLLVSLFVALRRSDEEPAPATTASSQGPGTVHIDYAVSGGRPTGGIARDSVSRGRIVVIRVTSDVADRVHLHGYDLTSDVGPGTPAKVSFTATAPGGFELELEESGVQIGELEVRP